MSVAVTLVHDTLTIEAGRLANSIASVYICTNICRHTAVLYGSAELLSSGRVFFSRGAICGKQKKRTHVRTPPPTFARTPVFQQKSLPLLRKLLFFCVCVCTLLFYAICNTSAGCAAVSSSETFFNRQPTGSRGILRRPGY